MIIDSSRASSLVSATSTQSPVITFLLPKLVDTPHLLLILSFSVVSALSFLKHYILMAVITTLLSCLVAPVHSVLFGLYSLPDLMLQDFKEKSCFSSPFFSVGKLIHSNDFCYLVAHSSGLRSFLSFQSNS